MRQKKRSEISSECHPRLRQVSNKKVAQVILTFSGSNNADERFDALIGVACQAFAFDSIWNGEHSVHVCICALHDKIKQTLFRHKDALVVLMKTKACQVHGTNATQRDAWIMVAMTTLK